MQRKVDMASLTKLDLSVVRSPEEVKAAKRAQKEADKRAQKEAKKMEKAQQNELKRAAKEANACGKLAKFMMDQPSSQMRQKVCNMFMNGATTPSASEHAAKLEAEAAKQEAEAAKQDAEAAKQEIMILEASVKATEARENKATLAVVAAEAKAAKATMDASVVIQAVQDKARTEIQAAKDEARTEIQAAKDEARMEVQAAKDEIQAAKDKARMEVQAAKDEAAALALLLEDAQKSLTQHMTRKDFFHMEAANAPSPQQNAAHLKLANACGGVNRKHVILRGVKWPNKIDVTGLPETTTETSIRSNTTCFPFRIVGLSAQGTYTLKFAFLDKAITDKSHVRVFVFGCGTTHETTSKLKANAMTVLAVENVTPYWNNIAVTITVENMAFAVLTSLTIEQNGTFMS